VQSTLGAPISRLHHFSSIAPYNGDEILVIERMTWVDSARGLTIVLVVYAHSSRAIIDKLPKSLHFKVADEIIFPFTWRYSSFSQGMFPCELSAEVERHSWRARYEEFYTRISFGL
jgi:uncharacterized membrane protein YcfT